jgi:peptidoglycan/LPS O-acetylase OafA/YrhL
LTVCAGHLGLNTLGAQFGFQVKFELAVDVFFAISGFVLSRAYYFRRRGFRDLAVSRFARLYPLHLLTMLGCIGLSYPGGFDWTHFWQNLFLVHNIGLPPNRWAFNFPSWSISVEMAVSLAFYFVLRRNRVRLPEALLAVGVVLAALAIGSGLTPALNHFGVFNSGLVRGFAGFCLGSAAYLLTLRSPELCRKLRRPGLIAIAALVPFFLLQSWSLPAAALFAITEFLAVLACGTDGEVPLLSSPPFVWLGAVSYSVYLLHIPVLWTAAALCGGAVEGAGRIVVLAAVLAISHVSYRFFELPMQRWLLDALALRRNAEA